MSIDKSNDKNKFYFQGKYFEKEEDFWKWTKEWKNLPLDQETADRQLNTLKKDIIMNIFLRGINVNNVQFREYLNKIFEFSMTEMEKLHDVNR